MIFRRSTFTSTIADLETGVRARDTEAADRAFDQLQKSFAKAGPDEIAAGAPRLAALLPEVPLGPRSMLAVIIGACVERGADPAGCAPAVLREVGAVLTEVRAFVDQWASTGGGELPVVDQQGPSDEVVARVGASAALAWWTLQQWEMAALAMLNDQNVRTALSDRDELLTAALSLYEATQGDLKCLTYALLVLDDEPLVALHRETRTGYLLRMSGLGDNFQLHTLLAGELVSGGHVPGDAPSAQAVAACRDAPGFIQTTGAFNLVTADGTWIWNEGTPSDITPVRGTRLVVLDKPPYSRGWDAGRFFPGMRGSLTLERVLSPEETESWFADVSPAKDFHGTTA
ncbi:hypothetical protein [Kribbella sp. VKM Ac-2568]|uniref:hypothetical protein n=1 Tax=Kribbella sp. VKM Ac-2568 TaxID=2512219 RepID=UPI00104B1BD2|nr:hypothetical protein [Kribbella sp. VKM Ac-2568]TCM44493.1 hypothetical protein EV648_108365 [Kribbella sp. VKM Ac-2568]